MRQHLSVMRNKAISYVHGVFENTMKTQIKSYSGSIKSKSTVKN